jgi:hypothetical protein
VNDDVRAGNLASKLDVIILPSDDARAILDGHAAATMPAEYVGGIGPEGAAALRAFVDAGGTLLAIDEASEFVLQAFGLPVRNAVAGLRSTEFYCPGSLLRIQVDQASALTAGLPPEQAAFFVNGRAFAADPSAADRVRVLARYATARDQVLMSGWINGPQHLAGQAAVVDVTVGKGRVVLTGFGVQFRGQPHGTFKWLFNPILEAGAASRN